MTKHASWPSVEQARFKGIEDAQDPAMFYTAANALQCKQYDWQWDSILRRAYEDGFKSQRVAKSAKRPVTGTPGPSGLKRRF